MTSPIRNVAAVAALACFCALPSAADAQCAGRQGNARMSSSNFGASRQLTTGGAYNMQAALQQQYALRAQQQYALQAAILQQQQLLQAAALQQQQQQILQAVLLQQQQAQAAQAQRVLNAR